MRCACLILVCGLPGSGKTTHASRLEQARSAIRMNADDWIEALLDSPENTRERDRLRDPVENLQWELAKDYLRKGLTVILENGFWAEEERSLYLMEALELGAKVELHYMEAPDFEALWERVSRRNETFATETFVMYRGDLEAAWKLFQAPTPEEMSFYDQAAVVDFACSPE